MALPSSTLPHAVAALLIITISGLLFLGAYFSPNLVVADRYAAGGMLSFAWTYTGFWGYSRYYATKKGHSALFSGLYTLVFAPYFVYLIIVRPETLDEM